MESISISQVRLPPVMGSRSRGLGSLATSGKRGGGAVSNQRANSDGIAPDAVMSPISESAALIFAAFSAFIDVCVFTDTFMRQALLWFYDSGDLAR